MKLRQIKTAVKIIISTAVSKPLRRLPEGLYREDPSVRPLRTFRRIRLDELRRLRRLEDAVGTSRSRRTTEAPSSWPATKAATSRGRTAARLVGPNQETRRRRSRAQYGARSKPRRSMVTRSKILYVTTIPGLRISIRSHRSGKSGEPSCPNATRSPSSVAAPGAP